MFSAKLHQRWVADYTAMLDRARTAGDTLPSWDVRRKQNRMVRELIEAGIWSELDLFYVFAHDGNEAFNFNNWKSSSFRLTKSGTTTFTANDGIKGNGTTGFYNTGFKPLTNGVKYQQNSASVIVQVKESTAATEYVYGAIDTGTLAATILRPRGTIDATVIAVNDAGRANLTSVDASGLWHLQRDSVSNFNVYKNGSLIAPANVTSAALVDHNIYIMATNNGGAAATWSQKTIRVFAMGSVLTGKAATFNSIWNTYFNSL